MTPTIVGVVLVATLVVSWITRHRRTRYRRFAIALLLAQIVGLVVTFIQLRTLHGGDWVGNLVASPRTRNVNLAITSQKPIFRMTVQWTEPKG